MAAYASVAVLLLAGWAALNPEPMSWAYLAAVAVFELWLARRMINLGRNPVSAREAPYHFSEDEAQLVGRYRFYFTYPALARESASVLAAIGLSALVLAFWLLYKQAFVQAVLAGVNLLAVARFTKLLAPQMALRITASRGDRAALRLLEAHDPAWAKIRAANRFSDLG
jgi:hypothetical protein